MAIIRIYIASSLGVDYAEFDVEVSPPPPVPYDPGDSSCRYGRSPYGQVRYGNCAVLAPELLVYPQIISDAGGDPITIRGPWSSSDTVRFHFGALHTVDDPLCYCGQGYGYERIAPTAEVTIWTPPTPVGQAYVTLEVGDIVIPLDAEIAVVERTRRSRMRSMLANFAPWYARQGVLR
ncbi:MAG: hypothetical protein MUC88_00485 [Planctomycetes bacterium]|jgi:hypothetical protein|nr:hypothetical protein [Planctomycetota bacterium]